MATTSPPSAHGPRPRLTAQIKGFWQRVTEGRELSQLWLQFRAEARASYHLYQRDFDARSPRETRAKNFFHTAQEFAWALLEKLTPARRVLLLLGIVLVIFPVLHFSYHDKTGLKTVDLDIHFYGVIALFVLLLLEIADRVVMKRDLEIARDIQSWLLPPTPPEIPGLRIAFATRPANTVAGDYYDIFPRPSSIQSSAPSSEVLSGGVSGESSFLFVVADVAGKSIPAALLMATMQASLRTLSATSSTLRDLVQGLNHYACSNSQGGLRYTTAFLAEFDPASRAFTYINAGHNNPVLRRASGKVERLIAGGLPLGIRDEATYESDSAVLQPGDWLLIFTDGLVEANDQNDHEYGETRMLNVLNAGTDATPSELLNRMMADLDIFVGATPQHDDVTCMLIKVEAHGGRKLSESL
ncbi:MAG TPA: PP2C family protein-serine/threonine phosphatase [Terriglobales bacterium]|jgi:serine phosphatase RsbU (regulator of sigma subunit)